MLAIADKHRMNKNGNDQNSKNSPSTSRGRNAARIPYEEKLKISRTR
jgi:hypothetical protein